MANMSSSYYTLPTRQLLKGMKNPDRIDVQLQVHREQHIVGVSMENP